MELIKFYGRGGQGIVTASKMMVSAANSEGRYAHSIPSFGQERKGAPVFTFARISDEPIDSRSFVYNCNSVIVFDYYVTQLGIDITEGATENSFALINTDLEPVDFDLGSKFTKVACVDAFGITKKVIGQVPPNAAMLGALCASKEWFDFGTLTSIIKSTMPGKRGDLNVEAARRGFENVKIK